MPRNLTDIIPVSTDPNNTINVTAIDNFEAAILNYIYTHDNDPAQTTPRAAGNLVAGANAWTLDEIRVIFMTFVFHFAHNGTSTATTYNFPTVTLPRKGTTAAEVWNLNWLSHLFSENNVTYRMYGRQYANAIFKFGKANNTEWRLGKKHGIDSKYGYCGFDFAIYVDKMNTHERAAADAVFQIAIARASKGAEHVSNAVELTKGVLGSSSRTIMF